MSYQIQFPGLMKGKKIMYVHGFCSSAQSGTVKRLRSMLPDAEVVAYDLPIRPEEAMALLREKCESEKPDMIIGTSMGGMYSEMLYGYDRIIVNPAFEMGSTIKDHGMMGKQVFFNPREDGVQEFIVTKELAKEYREMTQQCFAEPSATPEEQGRVYGLFGMEDPLVHTFDLFRSHYPNALRFHGEHQLTDKVTIHSLIPVIRWIDDRQEGREREIIYVALDALRSAQISKGETAFMGYVLRSSAAKALGELTEYYDVRFVAPAPTNAPEQIADDVRWIEDQVGVIAYDRINLTNRPDMLYGDYFIGTPQSLPSKKGAFMGTAIEFGSDQFKTWEEIITYFSRLR